MASQLTWLDHDAAARDRSLRILALFKEKESRDELGIGGVRDAIADRLFPGTSTIQTRLRYMLIVPWMYRGLEKKEVPAKDFAAQARRAETDMILPLLDAEEEGVFGRRAKGGLKRLPSSVYWLGLRQWGIRRFDGAQGDYHQNAYKLYARQVQMKKTEDDDFHPDPAAETWHPRLPKAPVGFPNTLDFKLTRKEGEFLLDRISANCKDSLLAWLSLHGKPDACGEPWLHHQLDNFPQPMKNLLRHARLFSDTVEGAARLYNLCLAEQRGDDGLRQEHAEALEDWRGRLDWPLLDAWSLDELWGETDGPGHAISPITKDFVEHWVGRMRAMRGKVENDAAARELVRQREIRLKGARSRFNNPGALQQWSGRAGIARLVYRWPTARGFLRDLYLALDRK